MGEPLPKERTIEKMLQTSFAVLDFIDTFRASYPAKWKRVVRCVGPWGERRRYTVRTYLSNGRYLYSQKPDSQHRPWVHWSEGASRIAGGPRRRNARASEVRGSSCSGRSADTGQTNR